VVCKKVAARLVSGRLARAVLKNPQVKLWEISRHQTVFNWYAICHVSKASEVYVPPRGGKFSRGALQ
jgi:hypothetical protein